jgi:phage shock protein PspC (stress-responsive transcriptional regulator)
LGNKIKKNPGIIILLWVLIAAILSGIATLWTLDTGFTENPKIFMIYFGILLFPIIWLRIPSNSKKKKEK